MPSATYELATADTLKPDVSDSQLTERKSRSERLREQLLNNLNGTTELAALQERLLNSLTQGMGVDGLHYQHEALDVDIQIGSEALHSCGYRLLATNEYLGEITFKRNRRFSERELALIESVIPALMKPLRASLKTRER
ncbi:hypothetical protein QGM61_04215 [Pseudohongiella sp. SYSU M77423]|uniref:hypothetical protein n=1 Tax=unclassified Pseudohongiella TaxID=2629611 RepID=UPI001F1865CE|nr:MULTISPECIES: hypothetical protein [unclassified Pseudohongiella]MDH7943018.1 hypothetical protein [Pseudohongiella sp. SYSU M77423]MEC8860153.1 hypothetical protein [Pseudomonadota bacterium]